MGNSTILVTSHIGLLNAPNKLIKQGKVSPSKQTLQWDLDDGGLGDSLNFCR